MGILCLEEVLGVEYESQYSHTAAKENSSSFTGHLLTSEGSKK